MNKAATVVDFVENYFSDELSSRLISHIGTLARKEVLSFYDLFWEQSDSFLNTSREDTFPSPMIGICANIIPYRHSDFDLIMLADTQEKIDPVIENIKRFLVYYKTVTVPINNTEFQAVQVSRELFHPGLLQNFVRLLLDLKPLIKHGYVNVVPVKKGQDEIDNLLWEHNPEFMKRLYDPDLFLSGRLNIDATIALTDLTYCKYLNADFVTNRLPAWNDLNAIMGVASLQPPNTVSNEQNFICYTNEINLPNIANLSTKDIIALRESSIEFQEWYNLVREIMERVQTLNPDSSSLRDDFLNIANRHSSLKLEQVKKEIKETSLRTHIKGAAIKFIQAYAALKIAEPLLSGQLSMDNELTKIAASGLVGLTEVIKYRFSRNPKLALLHHLSLFGSKDA